MNLVFFPSGENNNRLAVRYIQPFDNQLSCDDGSSAYLHDEIFALG